MRRGAVVAAFGLVIWALSRFTGSAGLHLISVGLIALPAIAWGVGARRARGAFTVTRRLSAHRVSVDERLELAVTILNRGPRRSSFLLVEDRLPPALGGRQRFVADRIPGGNAQTVAYAVTPHRRGRYSLPRLVLEASDPFDLTRVRLSSGEPVEVLVAPKVERLGGAPPGAFGAGRGESLSRQLYLAGDEFYTIREYQTGDDLRRIHWPSVARSGALMIRQDEAARRASAIVFLDTRTSLLGHDGDPPFERAVSATASLGALFLDNGYELKLASTDRPPRKVTEGALLDQLTVIGPSGTQYLGAGAVRSASDSATTLVLVTGVPGEMAMAPLLSLGAGFGRRLVVLVHRADPRTDSGEWRAAESRAVGAARTLRRAGWDVFILHPNSTLEEAWRHPIAASAS